MNRYAYSIFSIFLILFMCKADAQDASTVQSYQKESVTSSCMDEYFFKLEFPGPLVNHKQGPGKWELAMELSRVSDDVALIACLPSTLAAKNQTNSDAPSLFLICIIGSHDMAFIVTADYDIQNDLPVVTRFDGEKPETTIWKTSPDKKAIIAPMTGGKFASLLMMHDELAVQLTLSDQRQVAFTYDLQGTSVALQNLSSGCNWE